MGEPILAHPWELATPTVCYDPAMNVDLRKVDDVVIVDFDGSLTLGTGDELLGQVIDQLLAEDYRKILLDLTDVDFIDSSGLGELVQSLKVSRRFGASLRLLKPQDRVRRTLNLTKILPMFPIHETEAEALESFATEVVDGESES